MASTEIKLLRYLLALCINFQLLEMNRSESRIQDDVIDRPIPNKIIDCATAR